MESRTKVLDQMRLTLRLSHMSLRTEQVYVGWTRRFILFHNKRHPKDRGANEIRAFLTHLAVNGRVAASTQNVALNALLFLYRHVLQQEFPTLDHLERAKRPRRVPTVFTREDVAAVLAQLTGMNHLMASLLYGAGLRLMECLRLRVKDLDFGLRSPCRPLSATQNNRGVPKPSFPQLVRDFCLGYRLWGGRRGDQGPTIHELSYENQDGKIL